MTDRAAIAAGYYGGGGFGGIGLIVLIIVRVLAVAVSGEQRRRNAWPGRTAERAVTCFKPTPARSAAATSRGTPPHMTRIDFVALQQRLAPQQPKPATPVRAEPPSWGKRPAPAQPCAFSEQQRPGAGFVPIANAGQTR